MPGKRKMQSSRFEIGGQVAEINALLADGATSKNQKIMAINRIQECPQALKMKGIQAAQCGRTSLPGAAGGELS